ATVIRHRFGHVIASVARHPDAKAQVEVFDPAREINRVVAAQGQEPASVDRQYGSYRGGQVLAAEGRLESWHPALPLSQAKTLANPRPHSLVSPAVERPAAGS